MSADTDVARDLGAYLTGAEAGQLADQLESGLPAAQIKSGLAPARRTRTWDLLGRAGVTTERRAVVQMLRAIEGARASSIVVSPVWTAPDNFVGAGKLTSTLHEYVDKARESVICATYNFQRSSALWESLKATAARPELDVRVYMDTGAADRDPAGWKPSTTEVASALHPAAVYRSIPWQGKQTRTHAKFIAIDHQYLIVMSANFSKSAELHNIELGLVVHDRAACEGVISTFEGYAGLFERVTP